MHKISVLVPTFNRATLIGETLSNIQLQTYNNLHTIVYDDGSIDDTYNIVKKYNNIEYIRSRKNKGVAYARNCLLKACKTEYACWWDSDDLCNIYRISTQYKSISKKQFDIVYTGFRTFNANNMPNCYEKPKHINNAKIPKTPSEKCPHFANASILFRVDKSIQFNEEKRFGGEDYQWARRMKMTYHPAYINKILYYVRKHFNRIGVIRKKVTPADRMKSYADAYEKFKR